MSACENCMDNSGYTSGESIRSTAYIAATGLRSLSALNIATVNANSMINSYKLLHDIAVKSVALAERQQQRLKDVFWTREIEQVNEFGNKDYSLEDPFYLGRRYAGRIASVVTAGFARQMKQLKCNASRYCTSAFEKSRQDLIALRTAAQLSARQLGRNIGYAEHMTREETDWNRRMQAAALGRGLMTDAANLMSAAAGGLASSASLKAQTFNSSMANLGYNVGQFVDAFKQYKEVRNSNGGTYTMAKNPAAMNDPTKSPTGLGGHTSPSYGVLASDGVFSQAGVSAWSWDGGKFMSDLMAPSQQQKAYDAAGDFVLDTKGYGQGAYGESIVPVAHDRVNYADVGNVSLARTGAVSFPVSGGAVKVSMKAFGLAFTDDLSESDATNTDGGTVITPRSNPMVG